MLDGFIQQLQEKRDLGLYRDRLLQSPDPHLINFASNDYLGLSQHSEIKNAFKQGVDHWGLGSTASQLVCGYTKAHQDLEDALCQFTGMEKAILFPCGYMANMGAITALATQFDILFHDKLNHASLIDGIQLSGARAVRYAHLDVPHLAQRMSGLSARRKWIVTEGVFSMEGDIAPLPELLAQAEKHEALLLLDDSHALGVLGNKGRGTLSHFNCEQSQNIVLIGSFGKAFGLSGAFVAGSTVLIEMILQFARTYMFTTGLMPALACAIKKSLELVQQGELTAKLQSNIHYFRHRVEEWQLPFLPSHSAIQAYVVKDVRQVMLLANQCREQGFWVGAMRPPTVGPNQSRLRISLSAEHTFSQIEALLKILKREGLS